MSESSAWAFPDALQPQPGDVAFDVEALSASVVRVRAAIPDDAFTAPVLGTEREGNGIVIRDDGLVLTIGYLITEAATTWLTTRRGEVVPAHPIVYDYASGFGLLHPLGRLDAPPMAIGDPARVGAGDEVCVIGYGGRRHALKAKVFAKREFAGYWEYVLDEAFFTTPRIRSGAARRWWTPRAGWWASARCSCRSSRMASPRRATCSCPSTS
jgi:S1-C subfamily serine protease